MNEAEYEVLLKKAYALMDAAPGSDDERELIRLAALIEAYEAEHYPIEPPTPEEAIKFRREQEE